MEPSNPLLKEVFLVVKACIIMTYLSCFHSMLLLIKLSVVFSLQSFFCEKFKIYWFISAKGFSKLDTYMSFKSKFCMEGYLDSISRVWYAKGKNKYSSIRYGTGRFNKTPRNERFYTLCKVKQKPSVEDEMHCPRYARLRKDLYDCIHYKCPKFKDVHDGHNLITY